MFHNDNFQTTRPVRQPRAIYALRLSWRLGGRRNMARNSFLGVSISYSFWPQIDNDQSRSVVCFFSPPDVGVKRCNCARPDSSTIAGHSIDVRRTYLYFSPKSQQLPLPSLPPTTFAHPEISKTHPDCASVGFVCSLCIGLFGNYAFGGFSCTLYGRGVVAPIRPARCPGKSTHVR